MFPTVSPPTTKHITPRLHIPCTLRFFFFKLRAKNLIPHSYFKRFIALESGDAFLRQSKLINTYCIQTVEKSMHIHPFGYLLQAWPIDL